MLLVIGGHARLRVPPVVTAGPGQLLAERRKEIEEAPGQDHDVEDVQPRRHHSCRVADA